MKCTSSVAVAHGHSCSLACGIFPNQGLNPFLLHWQVDSLPLSHLGSPVFLVFKAEVNYNTRLFSALDKTNVF